MELTIDSLKTMGAFSDAPVERLVKWEHGGESYEATVFVRPLSYHSAVNDLLAVHNKSDAVAGRIASCICDKDGKAVFTISDITGTNERGALNAGLTLSLLNVIAEVSGILGKPDGKLKRNSRTSKKSGTN
jgi:spore maturation protein SpmB